MRRDPIAPVCESRLPEWIGFQAQLPIAHIGLEVLREGEAAAAAAIDRAAAVGARHFTFDAAVPEDLDRIARLALNHYPQALLCGSAGLAKSMARALGSRRPHPNPNRHRADAPPAGHWLFACGSASERLRRQVQALAEQTDAGVLALDPDGFGPRRIPEIRDAVVRRAASRLAASDLVMTLARPSAEASLVDPDRLLAGFADAVHAVIAAVRPAGLFLSGGDTALAVLERLGARGIRLECELGSGLVFGRLAGGAMEGMPVVTKAGAFGPPDALLKLKKALAGAFRKNAITGS
jgi:uncharacterized protein YgbK (DUF1537 family)